MGTHRNIMRVASLLFCVYLFAATAIGEVGWDRASAGAAHAFRELRTLSARLGPNSDLQTYGPHQNRALEAHQPQSMQTNLGCSDLFEEETHSPFNIHHNTAPYILFALSGRNRRPTVRVAAAGWPAKLYLVNSTLLC